MEVHARAAAKQNNMGIATHIISLEKAPLQQLENELHRTPIVIGLNLGHPLVEDETHLAPRARRLVGILPLPAQVSP